MTEPKFKVGDVVTLKAGGPTMTINGVEISDVECVWFVKEKLSQGRFVPDTLVLVPEDRFPLQS